jgi:hypothetical protein
MDEEMEDEFEGGIEYVPHRHHSERATRNGFKQGFGFALGLITALAFISLLIYAIIYLQLLGPSITVEDLLF